MSELNLFKVRWNGKKPKVIAFTGLMQSGKTTAMQMLQNILPYSNSLKFAQPIYDMQEFIYARAGLTLHEKDRKLMQYLGTDWGRDKDKDLWLKAWTTSAKAHLDSKDERPVVLVCDDVRFDNEAQTVKDLGGCIVKVHCSELRRSERSSLTGSSHVSENGIDGNYVNYLLYNEGSLVSLENQVKALLKDLGYL
jgi:hypothetical protein